MGHLALWFKKEPANLGFVVFIPYWFQHKKVVGYKTGLDLARGNKISGQPKQLVKCIKYKYTYNYNQNRFRGSLATLIECDFFIIKL